MQGFQAVLGLYEDVGRQGLLLEQEVLPVLRYPQLQASPVKQQSSFLIQLLLVAGDASDAAELNHFQSLCTPQPGLQLNQMEGIYQRHQEALLKPAFVMLN